MFILCFNVASFSKDLLGSVHLLRNLFEGADDGGVDWLKNCVSQKFVWRSEYTWGEEWWGGGGFSKKTLKLIR